MSGDKDHIVSKLDALIEKSKQSREITDKYYSESAALVLADKIYNLWLRFLDDPKLRAIWMNWERAGQNDRELFITGSVNFLSDEFRAERLPVRFLPFIPGQTPAAEFSPDGFVFYGHLFEWGIAGQVTHELVHYLQSTGKSSMPVTAILLAYTFYITPVRASATDKTAQFVRRAYENLTPMTPESDRSELSQAYENYVRDGQMFDNFGIDPTDDERKIISEIYRESIIEKEAATIGDYVRLKLADLLHKEKMSAWQAASEN